MTTATGTKNRYQRAYYARLKQDPVRYQKHCERRAERYIKNRLAERTQSKKYRSTDSARAKSVMRQARLKKIPITDSENTVLWFIVNQKTCQICGRPDSGQWRRPNLFLDHDHKTGKVRGMLCNKCNMAAQDSEHAKKILAYLHAHETGFAELMRKVAG